jgi:hypothetical protein
MICSLINFFNIDLILKKINRKNTKGYACPEEPIA